MKSKIRHTLIVATALLLAPPVAPAEDTPNRANFTTGAEQAVKRGVHEIVLSGDGGAANPFDTRVTVTFTPASGEAAARTVQAFYDGGHAWRARVYVSEAGPWRWESRCETDARLNGKTGDFAAVDSRLRGRLLPHPKNPRQWITEDGRWFLNLSDTAYFLLCNHDGNGKPVTDDDALRYLRDDVARGITSVRCFLTASESGFTEASRVWDDWFFTDARRDHLRLDNLQCADRRLRMLLDQFPDVAVQVILFPLEAYGRDDRYWSALTPARRERLLRQLIARYAAYPQIFWLLVNDAHYGPQFPNSNAMAREVGAWLQKNDAWQHPRSTGHARKLPFYFGGEDWATYVHIEHEHDLGAAQYERYHEFRKPVFLGEDRYEQDHGPRRDPAHMREWQRRLFWTWLLSGGSANYGGRWWAVQPYSETGERKASFHKRPNVIFTQPLTGLDSVKAIRDYVAQRRIDLGEFQPDHALARDAVLMRRGQDEYLAYAPHGEGQGRDMAVKRGCAAVLQIDLRQAAGSFSVEWYRASDGMAIFGSDVRAGNWSAFTAPWPGADVILRLQRSPDRNNPATKQHPIHEM